MIISLAIDVEIQNLADLVHQVIDDFPVGDVFVIHHKKKVERGGHTRRVGQGVVSGTESSRQQERSDNRIDRGGFRFVHIADFPVEQEARIDQFHLHRLKIPGHGVAKCGPDIAGEERVHTVLDPGGNIDRHDGKGVCQRHAVRPTCEGELALVDGGFPVVVNLALAGDTFPNHQRGVVNETDTEVKLKRDRHLKPPAGRASISRHG